MNKIIGYIENGIVIDHITVGKVWRLIELLNVNKRKTGRISVGEGYQSNKIGSKGLLKIEGLKVSDYELNFVSLVCENASVSVIENGIVSRKIKAEIPEILNGIIKCKNHNCITNDDHERVSPMIRKNENGKFKCHYCNNEFRKDELDFVNGKS